MIIVVEDYNREQHARLLDDMFKLRARVFKERLRWDVDVVDGRERDAYDSCAPVYLIYTGDDGATLKGSLRLLPTTGPTLLAEHFADTIPDAALLSAPTIWECTRFCLDHELLSSADDLLSASGVLIAGLGELAVKAGIETVIGNFEPLMLRIYRRLGCEVEVIGSARRDGRIVCLGAFYVSEPILDRVKARVRRLSVGQDGHGRASIRPLTMTSPGDLRHQGGAPIR